MLREHSANKFLSILLVAFLLIAATFAFIPTQVYAENTSIKIDLLDDSKFDAYNDVFAYTYGTTIYVVQNDVLKPYRDAFVGECLGIEVNDKNVLVFAKNGTSTTITYYDYDANGIKSAKTKLGTLDMPISNIYGDDEGNFYLVCNFSTSINVMKVFKENTSIQNMPSAGQTIDTSYKISSYYFDKASSLYAIIENKVYVANASLPIAPDSSNKFVQIEGIDAAYSLSMSQNEIFVNSQNGIYKIDPATKAATKVGQAPLGTGKICYTSIKDKDYVFVCEQKAIIQYSYNGTTCEYYNKFNNSEYVHPTNFDLLYVAKATAASNVYSSPRNLQVISNISANEYFMVLCSVNSEESGNYFYIVRKDGTMGYIKSSTEFTQIPANKDVTTLKIGLYAQPLFPNTKIYKYPYSDSEILSDTTIYDELIVLDNVAQEGENQVWDYYTVSFVKDGAIQTGYVKASEVSPYTSLKAPAILSTVKISSGAIGAVVYLYALPSESSAQVAQLIDGEELDLAEEYNKDSEWTKVVYKDIYAYVKTSQIEPKGLTPVQITLIVVSVVVVAVSVVMVIILRKKRKIGF